MSSPLPYPIHTIAETATQISQGEDPWFALGSFLHDWWCDANEYRQDLVADAPSCPTTQTGKRWAALCAAVVEELCSRTGFPYPTWIYQPQYVLEDPWFYSAQPSQHDWLLATTPATFRCRNIFIAGNVLDNKYELQQLVGPKPRWTLWSDQELQDLSASNASSEAKIIR